MRSFQLVLATAVISGFSIYVNKLLLVGQDPLTMTFAKMAVAALVMLAVGSVRRTMTPSSLGRDEWLKLALVGLIGGCVPFLLFFYALAMTSAASASFIHKTMFIFASIFSYTLLRERFPRFKVAGMVLAFVGVALLLGLSGISFGYFDAIILVATLFWAGEQVMSKYLLRTVHPDVLASARLGFGSIFIFIFLVFRGFGHVSVLPVLVSSAFLVAYVLTWYRGLQGLDVSTATTVLLIGSVVTTFLQLNLSFYGVIGSILILAAALPMWKGVAT
jgi:drug/metabolite transporter (DMT)-like permease